MRSMSTWRTICKRWMRKSRSWNETRCRWRICGIGRWQPGWWVRGSRTERSWMSIRSGVRRLIWSMGARSKQWCRRRSSSRRRCRSRLRRITWWWSQLWWTENGWSERSSMRRRRWLRLYIWKQWAISSILNLKLDWEIWESSRFMILMLRKQLLRKQWLRWVCGILGILIWYRWLSMSLILWRKWKSHHIQSTHSKSSRTR